MASARLSDDIIGTWRLESREDRTFDGRLVHDEALGPAPDGLLFYDRGGNFAAQFMKRDRSSDLTAVARAGTPGANNTNAVGGYDAYFGVYSVDNETGCVTQTLVGALSAGNVGQTVTRALHVSGDSLVVSLDTVSLSGHPIRRTLTWRRVG